MTVGNLKVDVVLLFMASVDPLEDSVGFAEETKADFPLLTTNYIKKQNNLCALCVSSEAGGLF